MGPDKSDVSENKLTEHKMYFKNTKILNNTKGWLHGALTKDIDIKRYMNLINRDSGLQISTHGIRSLPAITSDPRDIKTQIMAVNILTNQEHEKDGN